MDVPAHQKVDQLQSIKRKKISQQVDEDYFKSYDALQVHELMLKDKPRVLAYQQAILKNAKDFAGKVVLDVGTGTGILSLFAVRDGGAKKVYAVEASLMSLLAENLIATNGFADRIEILHGRIETIELPEKVDIIISEWMGFFLLHESMLDSVLFARDKWLKPGGFVFPNRAKLLLCPVSMEEYVREKFQYWENVYGFDFSVCIPEVKKDVLAQPIIEIVKQSQLLAEPTVIQDINIHTINTFALKDIFEELTFTATKGGTLHGFTAWFEVIFEGDTEKDNVTLDTSPTAPDTHWKQTTFLLPTGLPLQVEQPIQCRIRMTTDSENQRHYNVTIEMRDETMKDDHMEDNSEQEDIEHLADCGCGRCCLLRALNLEL